MKQGRDASIVDKVIYEKKRLVPGCSTIAYRRGSDLASCEIEVQKFWLFNLNLNQFSKYSSIDFYSLSPNLLLKHLFQIYKTLFHIVFKFCQPKMSQVYFLIKV